MQNTKKLNVTDSEWKLMRIIWTLGETTSKKLIDILTVTTDWKAATIKTLLHRLMEKGIVDAKKDGNKFIYSSNISEQETIDLAANQLLKQVCAMRVGSMVADVIEESELTQQDIDLIQEKLNNKTPVKTIKCNCLPSDMMKSDQ